MIRRTFTLGGALLVAATLVFLTPGAGEAAPRGGFRVGGFRPGGFHYSGFYRPYGWGYGGGWSGYRPYWGSYGYYPYSYGY